MIWHNLPIALLFLSLVSKAIGGCTNNWSDAVCREYAYNCGGNNVNTLQGDYTEEWRENCALTCGVCACTDGVKNFDETGVDCGGSWLGGCGACDETSDTNEETCTGDFEADGRPPAGTKCEQPCEYVGKGYYYGDSYCYTTKATRNSPGDNWGATCKSPNDFQTGTWTEWNNDKVDPGKPCTSCCYFNEGRWGASWCKTTNGKWGAPCLKNF